MINTESMMQSQTASDFEVIASPSTAGSSVAHSEMGLQVNVSNNTAGNVTGSPQTPPSLTDLTLDEARHRLMEFSLENTELQNYLKENNEMMKRQFETLADWKKKVHDANICNREKFDKTKSLITTLRTDNKISMDKVSILEKDLQIKHQQTTELELKLEQMATEKERVQELLDSLKHSMASLQRQDDGLDNMETVLVKLSEEKQNELSELRTIIKQKDYDLQESRQANENLLQDLKDLQKLKEQIQQDYQRISRENMELNQKMEMELVCTSYNSMNWMNVNKRSVEESREQGPEAKAVCLEAVNINMKESTERVEDNLQQKPVDDLIKRQEAKNQEYEEQIKQLHKDIQIRQDKVDEVEQGLNRKQKEIQDMKGKHEQEVLAYSKQYEDKMADFARKQDKDREEQLRTQTSRNETVDSLKAQVIELMKEVHDLASKLEAANSSIDRKTDRIKEFEERHEKTIRNVNSMENEKVRVISTLQTRINNLQVNYKQEQEQHVITKNDFEELRKSFNKLIDDYKDVLEKFAQYKNSQDVTATSEVHKLRDQVNKLTCQVIVAEEALTLRDEEVERLKKDLQAERQEADERLNIYKAQADVFKSDFDAERQARETQVQEKVNILQDMEELRIQNQQLIDEMDVYSNRQLAEMQQRVTAVPQDHRNLQQHNYDYTFPAGLQNTTQQQMVSAADYQTEEVEFLCPKCELRCPDLDTLQIHVMECLELD